MLVRIWKKDEKERILDELEDRGFKYQKCYYNSAFDTDRKKCLETDKPLDIDLAVKTISIFRSVNCRWYDIYNSNTLYDALHGRMPQKKEYEKGFVTVSGNQTREAEIIKRDREFTIVRFPGSSGAIRVRNERVFYAVSDD
ncbi:MAG: hypothetical protein IKE93_05405 [Erysipelotrichaceae bacterium]|jgi:hypothetical protein|nr:hypothetical protein [Erysipelotrichaceae bacterium]MBR2746120.1 hypothetical protein [Erysipelotrichaceae bacterium]